MKRTFFRHSTSLGLHKFRYPRFHARTFCTRNMCKKKMYFAPNVTIVGIYGYTNQIPIHWHQRNGNPPSHNSGHLLIHQSNTYPLTPNKWQSLRTTYITHHAVALKRLPHTYYAALYFLQNHGAYVTSQIKLQLWCCLYRIDKCIAFHTKSNLKGLIRIATALCCQPTIPKNSKYRAHGNMDCQNNHLPWGKHVDFVFLGGALCKTIHKKGRLPLSADGLILPCPVVAHSSSCLLLFLLLAQSPAYFPDISLNCFLEIGFLYCSCFVAF